MNSTVTSVEEIPTLDHDTAMAVAEVEYARLLESVEGLEPNDWKCMTDCAGWDVRAVLGHLLGMMELLADGAEFGRQVSIAGPRAAAACVPRIDALTALQVEEHAHLTTTELVAALRKATPAALAGRSGTTTEERAAVYTPGPPFDGEWTRGYLFDIIHTRDPWMHRVDIARATRRDAAVTPDHDGRIVANVVADWARTHGQPFTLVLDGPAGGTFVAGGGGDRYELDAVEFCRVLSGRSSGSGLLGTADRVLMSTTVDEIADGIYRLSTWVPEIAPPAGFTFNQFLIDAHEPLLFHTGPRAMYQTVSEAVATILPVERLRWITFGHIESDECGSMNHWLAAAPAAQVAHGMLGCMVSLDDLADRPPRPMADGEILDLGGKRVRHIDTPHVPHAWEARVLYEETTGTLLCGDLFTHFGNGPALTDDDIVGPAMAAEAIFRSTSLAPDTAAVMRRLAVLAPATLALMHGSSYNGDTSKALYDLASEYETKYLA